MLSVDIHHAQGDFTLETRFTAASGITALFGRSGSGKTTLINIVAGLIRPQKARIEVDGTVLIDTAAGIALPPHRRRVGYVFQESRLFPHLNVRNNLLYGRFFAGRGRQDAVTLDKVVALLGIGHLLTRRPGTLSGGEKQRVAIGRALLAYPRLLLMDEPLAALDDARKAEILPYLEALRDETRVPILYVSHAMGEVTRLATSLVVLEDGKVAAAGPMAEIVARMDVGPLSGRAQAGAVIDTVVASQDAEFGLTTLSSPAGELVVQRLALEPGTSLRIRIRARDVMIALKRPEGVSALNILAGTIAEIADQGEAEIGVRLDCNGVPLLARLTRRSAVALDLKVGTAVYGVIKAVAFDDPATTV